MKLRWKALKPLRVRFLDCEVVSPNEQEAGPTLKLWHHMWLVHFQSNTKSPGKPLTNCFLLLPGDGETPASGWTSEMDRDGWSWFSEAAKLLMVSLEYRVTFRCVPKGPPLHTFFSPHINSANKGNWWYGPSSWEHPGMILSFSKPLSIGWCWSHGI